jgi:hypothetical protein
MPLFAMGQWNTPNPVVSFEKTAKGLEVTQKDGVLRLEVDAEDLVHVTYAPLASGGGGGAAAKDWVVVKKDWPAAAFEVTGRRAGDCAVDGEVAGDD